MIIQFVDREQEQNSIKRLLRSEKFEFLILYGRRRIGKTELILHSTKEHKRLYFFATEIDNLQRFRKECQKIDPSISRITPAWEHMITQIFEKVDILIIDEFQNMIKEERNVLTILQHLIDTKLKNTDKKLILLGSSVSIMTSKVLSYSSPLYGRRTASMELKQIRFWDIRHFFPKAGLQELIEIYGFCGGTPHYLKKIDKGFWKWLEDELKDPASFLRDEVDFLLRYEFEDVTTYKAILNAIAFGKTKINEIKNYLNLKRTDITPYLKNLIEVGLIKRVIPMLHSSTSRSGRYFLKDNFLRFWFRYIHANISEIQASGLTTTDIKDYNQFLGPVFESICVRAAAKEYGLSKTGPWWHKDKEIDIIGTDDKRMLLAECKWKDKVNPQPILQELEEKSQHLPKGSRNTEYAIFAKSFTKKTKRHKDKNVHCHDLKDIGRALGK